ncbi:hypothetical protein H696_03963 [Fonticula alba]|uniref:RNA polymerase II-associated protein 1 C-terminal domain-containing protein n=1 Tax=Fonticula alba TaxID=691883 RepID=A0A058Z7R2_FONAL|nr:hypothetical protein H696_03963 [Fonticula alba]KCV69542.1 hypothetical protein H696_03963 [Fonticula alba]|eukprot:XP_009496107.1 hypothetical protein H696_03963 [Fonticula alba]
MDYEDLLKEQEKFLQSGKAPAARVSRAPLPVVSSFQPAVAGTPATVAPATVTIRKDVPSASFLDTMSDLSSALISDPAPTTPGPVSSPAAPSPASAPVTSALAPADGAPANAPAAQAEPTRRKPSLFQQRRAESAQRPAMPQFVPPAGQTSGPTKPSGAGPSFDVKGRTPMMVGQIRERWPGGPTAGPAAPGPKFAPPAAPSGAAFPRALHRSELNLSRRARAPGPKSPARPGGDTAPGGQADLSHSVQRAAPGEWEFDELQKINRENVDVLAGMSEEEILQAQQALRQSLSPSFLAFLENQHQASQEVATAPGQVAANADGGPSAAVLGAAPAAMRRTRDAFSRSADARAAGPTARSPSPTARSPSPSASPSTTVTTVDPLRERLAGVLDELIPDRRTFFSDDMIEVDKLAWLLPRDVGPDAEAARERASAEDELAAELGPFLASELVAKRVRFDFEGLIQPAAGASAAPDRSLFHHADPTGAAGYTLDELVLLLQSRHSAQRVLSLGALRRVIQRLKAGRDLGPGLAAPSGPGAALGQYFALQASLFGWLLNETRFVDLLVGALADRNVSVQAAAARCLGALVACPAEGRLLQVAALADPLPAGALFFLSPRPAPGSQGEDVPEAGEPAADAQARRESAARGDLVVALMQAGLAEALGYCLAGAGRAALLTAPAALADLLRATARVARHDAEATAALLGSGSGLIAGLVGLLRSARTAISSPEGFLSVATEALGLLECLLSTDRDLAQTAVEAGLLEALPQLLLYRLRGPGSAPLAAALVAHAPEEALRMGLAHLDLLDLHTRALAVWGVLLCFGFGYDLLPAVQPLAQEALAGQAGLDLLAGAVAWPGPEGQAAASAADGPGPRLLARLAQHEDARVMALLRCLSSLVALIPLRSAELRAGGGSDPDAGDDNPALIDGRTWSLVMVHFAACNAWLERCTAWLRERADAGAPAPATTDLGTLGLDDALDVAASTGPMAGCSSPTAQPPGAPLYEDAWPLWRAARAVGFLAACVEVTHRHPFFDSDFVRVDLASIFESVAGTGRQALRFAVSCAAGAPAGEDLVRASAGPLLAPSTGLADDQPALPALALGFAPLAGLYRADGLAVGWHVLGQAAMLGLLAGVLHCLGALGRALPSLAGDLAGLVASPLAQRGIWWSLCRAADVAGAGAYLPAGGPVRGDRLRQVARLRGGRLVQRLDHGAAHAVAAWFRALSAAGCWQALPGVARRLVAAAALAGVSLSAPGDEGAVDVALHVLAGGGLPTGLGQSPYTGDEGQEEGVARAAREGSGLGTQSELLPALFAADGSAPVPPRQVVTLLGTLPQRVLPFWRHDLLAPGLLQWAGALRGGILPAASGPQSADDPHAATGPRGLVLMLTDSHLPPGSARASAAGGRGSSTAGSPFWLLPGAAMRHAPAEALAAVFTLAQKGAVAHLARGRSGLLDRGALLAALLVATTAGTTASGDPDARASLGFVDRLLGWALCPGAWPAGAALPGRLRTHQGAALGDALLEAFLADSFGAGVAGRLLALAALHRGAPAALEVRFWRDLRDLVGALGAATSPVEEAVPLPAGWAGYAPHADQAEAEGAFGRATATPEADTSRRLHLEVCRLVLAALCSRDPRRRVAPRAAPFLAWVALGRIRRTLLAGRTFLAETSPAAGRAISLELAQVCVHLAATRADEAEDGASLLDLLLCLPESPVSWPTGPSPADAPLLMWLVEGLLGGLLSDGAFAEHPDRPAVAALHGRLAARLA